MDFCVDDLAGQVVERMVARAPTAKVSEVASNGRCQLLANAISAASIFLRVEGGLWQFFFLDAGQGIWSEPDDNDLEELIEGTDLVVAFDLRRAVISGVRCGSRADVDGVAFSIGMEGRGELVLYSVCPNDLDSPTFVSFLADSKAMSNGA